MPEGGEDDILHISITILNYMSDELITHGSLNVPIKDFVKRVMEPATGRSSTSVVHNYPKDHDVRLKHSYGHLEGDAIVEAVNAYEGKIDVEVARDKIGELVVEHAKASARKLELELENRESKTPGERGASKKHEFDKMRAEMMEEHKQSIKNQQKKLEKDLKAIKGSDKEPEGPPDMVID